MIVMITDEQILSASQVCPNCLMADRNGLPRWRRGQLGCGKALQQSTPRQAKIYKCQMGFNVTQVN
ncbi:hypothetical protein I4641_19210 [Waterburya agarophytonicola K14]|uniref:Uncharacterized protein n=2 Tax=Waterburya TaxID=2886915 RepID=A0A964BWN0_9CYAN|nr:hypothetical protein [Waterburya agarophytonicola KI4]